MYARRGMQKLYESVSALIFRELQLARRNENYITVAKQRELYNKVKELLSGFKDDATELFTASVYSAVDLTEKRIQRETRTAGIEISDDASKGNQLIADNAISELSESFDIQIQRMMQVVRKVTRKDAVLVMQKTFNEGISKKKASELLLPVMLDNIPQYFFVDRSGKKWKMDIYLDTLIVAVLGELELDIVVNMIEASGNDLMRVEHPGKEDMILSISGDSSKYPALVDKMDIFHPRSISVPHFFKEAKDAV